MRCTRKARTGTNREGLYPAVRLRPCPVEPLSRMADEQAPKRPRIEDEAVPMEAEPARAAPAVAAPAHENFSPELLKMYYDRVFPAELMCRWLSYGTLHLTDTTQALLHRREFSFTTGDDVYIRYLSFESAAALKKSLLKM